MPVNTPQLQLRLIDMPHLTGPVLKLVYAANR